jgi:hypothetical protein
MLHRVLVLVPLNADVVHWLLIQVLKQLRTELVSDFVLHVELAVELRYHIDRIIILDEVLLDLLLLFAEREDAVLGNEVAVTVS